MIRWSVLIKAVFDSFLALFWIKFQLPTFQFIEYRISNFDGAMGKNCTSQIILHGFFFLVQAQNILFLECKSWKTLAWPARLLHILRGSCTSWEALHILKGSFTSLKSLSRPRRLFHGLEDSSTAWKALPRSWRLSRVLEGSPTSWKTFPQLGRFGMAHKYASFVLI